MTDEVGKQIVDELKFINEKLWQMLSKPATQIEEIPPPPIQDSFPPPRDIYEPARKL